MDRMMIKSPAVLIKIVILVLALYMLSQITPIYLPIIAAVIVAFVLNPFVNAIVDIPLGARRHHLPRGIAILLVFLLAGLLLTLVTTFVLLPFINEFNKFVVDLPRLIIKIRDLTLLIEQQANLAQVPDNVRQLIVNGLGEAASYAVSLTRNALNTVLAFATQIVELVIVPVLAYYFLKDWKNLKDEFIALFPPTLEVKVVNVIEEMAIVVSNYIRGQVLISVIMGLLVFSGMYFLRVDYPLVLGLLATLTETIPIIGPIIGAIPALMLAYLVSPILATKVAAFYIIIHQIENHIVVPNIMGHTIDLHPTLIIISLLIGGQLYGIPGMILAVPVAALLKVLLRHLWYLDDDKKDR
ncbi:AI-2E family transporter [Sporomusa acidovorans]|uniref:Sodium-lithium/proton antiporter n=2 Tax=Sporomusa TaxID=2375 RepID=A0ABZ3J4T0_SPOA4|nr:AI-2E family transporter [Sporomusa acidovorans]OZC20876.1 AI-2 transport protein TqsA [Sporomusa acidovorans DSM 3132]SDE59884.1 Predicted PurR-regulated permease PerM [Sporomusa acidovorans]